MNIILSTLFIVLVHGLLFHDFTSERCSKYKWQRIEKYSGEKEVFY